MVHTAPASAPDAVEVVDIFDPSEANDTFELFDQDLLPLPSVASLKARRVIVRLEGCVLVYYSTNVRVRTRPTLQKDHFAYITFSPTATGTANGLGMRPEVMLAVPPGASLAVVAEPGYESVSFLLRPEDMREYLEASGQPDTPELRQHMEQLHVGASAAGLLFEWAKRLIDAALEQPDLFNRSPERRAAAKQDLMETLLITLASTSKVELERKDRTRQAQSDIVRAAEQYALAHTDERLYVKDLCQAAMVSERTLEYAFRAEMGLGPTAYLTRIRLHKVREALLRASATDTTVTQEALRWGFWHFGEFAKTYKECFQELPSDTLRRVQSR